MTRAGLVSCCKICTIIAERLTPTVYSGRFLDALAAVASGPLGVHVKLDTGMHRLGFAPDEAAVVAVAEMRSRMRVVSGSAETSGSRISSAALGRPASCHAAGAKRRGGRHRRRRDIAGPGARALPLLARSLGHAAGSRSPGGGGGGSRRARCRGGRQKPSPAVDQAFLRIPGRLSPAR